VLQEILHRHALAVRSAPFGKEGRDRLTKVERACADEAQDDAGRRDRLGQRSQVENGVLESSRGVTVEGQRPEGFAPEGAGARADLHDRGRKNPVVDRAAQERANVFLCPRHYGGANRARPSFERESLAKGGPRSSMTSMTSGG
jgi:hypothetical protein